MGQTVESSAATTSSITYTLRFGTDNNTVYWNRSSGTNGVTRQVIQVIHLCVGLFTR